MTAAAAVITVLAVYRLTLLVVADEVTAPIRDQLVRRLNERKHGPNVWTVEGWDGREDSQFRAANEAAWHARVGRDPHRLAFLLECPWCASPYVAAPVILASLWWAGSTAWWLTIGVAAASGVTGFLASKASP